MTKSQCPVVMDKLSSSGGTLLDMGVSSLLESISSLKCTQMTAANSTLKNIFPLHTETQD